MPTSLTTQITLDRLDGDRLIQGDGRLVSAVLSADVSLVGAAVRFILSVKHGPVWQHLLTLTRTDADLTITSETADALAIAILIRGDATENLVITGLGRPAQFDLELTPIGGQPITIQGNLQILPSTPTASTGTVPQSVMTLHLDDTDPHPQYVTAPELPGLIGGAGAIAYNAPANTVLSALRVGCIVAGQFVYADPSNSAHADLPLWFLEQSTAQGAIATGLSRGLFTDFSWNWGAESIYLGTNGTLTQSPSLSAAFIRKIAEPVQASTLFFNPEESVIL